MTQLRLASVCAIAGGLCWVARYLLDVGSATSDALFIAGAVLLTGAVAIWSLLSVRRAPVWLRLILVVCGPLLAWTVLLAIYQTTDSMDVERAAVDSVVGGLGVLIGVLRWRAGRRQRSRHRGAHAG